jgi:predicted nucleic acid-binding protein
MANLVVDASILIAVITNKAVKVKLIHLTQNLDLMAPYSVHWEIGNAFSAMFKRKRISIDDALQAIKAYKQIPIRFVNSEIEEAIQLAYSLKIYSYDAYLIQCAIKYNSPLLSLDQGLINSAKLLEVKVVEVPQ